MSNLSKQSAIIHNDDQQIMTTTNRITSLPLLQQKQHHERITANNLACDETHDLTSSSIKRNNDESNTKTRRLQSITNNNNNNNNTQNTCRTRTPVDSFVQLNLKPETDIKPDIHITLEDYKKAKDTMLTTKISSSKINRSSNPQSIESNQQNNIIKKTKTSSTNKSHEDASFGYFPGNDDNQRQHSRSSSSSSSTNQKNDLSINQINTFGHSKLIANNDFDSHGSSIATKSSSENSGSIRTGSGTDSDDEHKPTISSNIKSSSSQFFRDKYDDTPTIVLKKTSENRTSQHDRISTLPDQDSFELVKLNPTVEPPLHGPIPRFKQPAIDDPNGLHNDSPPYPTQRSQQNHLSSSSHQNRNPEHHDQYNSNHSNSSRKSSNRRTKKRKQLQQQEIIRTELIPGHRGDLDVDELVMFIDGNSSSKQRQNSAPLRLTDTNSNPTTSTSRRKSRKPTKSLQDNENKTLQIDEDTQSISFIDDDDHTTTHSLSEQISLPNDDESHSNTTNGEISLPEWHSTSSTHDDIDSLSLSSTTLTNSNSEIISEPFVTVTHRRRSIKERRQDIQNNNNNNNNSSSRTSRFPDKRHYQPIQNGIVRPTISNIKPSISTTTTKEEPTTITSPPSISQTSTSVSNQVPEQSSPRLSSQSSSSSLSSSLKRQSKAPPVVFLNKSIDVELNDVSFGFDVDNSTAEEPPIPSSPPSIAPLDPSVEKEVNPSSSSSSPRRSHPQRNPRGPLFYSGTDIRPQQHRNYPPQSSYIDPLVLLQYQQRYQHLAYMNLLRTQYLPSQSPYVLIPTPATTSYETNLEEKDETSEQIQEPLLVYTTIPGQTGPIYYQPTKKSFQSVYPSQYFYPTHPAYFQPISSPGSLLIDNKSQHDETDNDEEDEEDDEENDLEKSTRIFQQTRQQSSSHIMSNALQLVYSQEKRNAQTDRFNLDQLTAYLAMKWTDTIDHYEQGDDEILLTGEQ
jgi:hypothetical protein